MSPAASTRWCPTPEQVMILEEMYRGGVRTPNAAQIQQITSHLSHYGKIEGKNVFYWFQNHKARDRQKLRKKLLGKQFQQHQQIFFSHNNSFPYHPFDQLPLPHHNNTYLHFDLPPPPPPPPPPPSLPCFGPTPPSLSLFNQLPPLISPCFATHQGRAEDVVQGVTNTFTWNSDENYGREKTKPSSMIRIITNDHDDDHHHHDHQDKNINKNDDENDENSRRPLKTLELFPIKDKTSLK